MPAGDNARIWFPEMQDELRTLWKPGSDWAQVNDICLHMGERLRAIRRDRGLDKPLRKSCVCGHPMVLDTRISIRSLLFSLRRIGLVTDFDFEKLDKEWKAYQQKNKLNAYFEPKGPPVPRVRRPERVDPFEEVLDHGDI